MAQSPEYPDLLWVPPKSWTDANRTSVQLIVIHTTEGSEGPTSAEDGAAYDQRRTDGTSTHFFHDADSTVQCVRTADIAHAARYEGNRRGIQHELCGRAGQTAGQWADPASQGTLRQAARQCARDAKKWGIPVRHLSVGEVSAGVKGFCGHYDITRAFPKDQGTHTDPGPNFPWSDFLDMVRAELEEMDMPTAAEIAEAVWSKALADPAKPGTTKTAGDYQRYNDVVNRNTIADFFFGAYHAAQQDDAYNAADADTQKSWRNARDTLRGVLGGPVDQGAILGAVDQVDEAVWSKISDPATPDEQVAAALDQLLGDRKASILALMQR